MVWWTPCLDGCFWTQKIEEEFFWSKMSNQNKLSRATGRSYLHTAFPLISAYGVWKWIKLNLTISKEKKTASPSINQKIWKYLNINKVFIFDSFHNCFICILVPFQTSSRVKGAALISVWIIQDVAINKRKYGISISLSSEWGNRQNLRQTQFTFYSVSLITDILEIIAK